MQLKGLLQSSLGGFVCVRGYATLGDLARASEADMSFQRNLIEEQRERIVEFLNNKEYLFFPEVILSYTLKYTYADGSSGIGVNSCDVDPGFLHVDPPLDICIKSKILMWV